MLKVWLLVGGSDDVGRIGHIEGSREPCNAGI